MTHNWHILTIQTSAQGSEVLSALCFSLGSCGLETEDREPHVRLTVYFPEALDLAHIEEELRLYAELQALSDVKIDRGTPRRGRLGS